MVLGAPTDVGVRSTSPPTPTASQILRCRGRRRTWLTDLPSSGYREMSHGESSYKRLIQGLYIYTRIHVNGPYLINALLGSISGVLSMAEMLSTTWMCGRPSCTCHYKPGCVFMFTCLSACVSIHLQLLRPLQVLHPWSFKGADL